MSESKGIKSELIPKMATGFCGGLSHTDGLCGTISVSALILSMFYGRSKPSDPREIVESKVQLLKAKFESQFCNTHCYKLTGCDLGTEEGQEKYDIEKKYELCDKFIYKATMETLELLDE